MGDQCNSCPHRGLAVTLVEGSRPPGPRCCAHPSMEVTIPSGQLGHSGVGGELTSLFLLGFYLHFVLSLATYTAGPVGRFSA